MATTDKFCPACNRELGFCMCGVEPTLEEVAEVTARQMMLFERRLDAQEELIANMMLAYSELTSTLEALILEVMAPRSEEEKEKFRRESKRHHVELLKAMQEVSRGLERTGPDLGPALEDLVGEDDSSPAEPQ